MNGGDERNRQYEVGYRKPPAHRRFPKGISGNPKGRRMGSRGFATIIRDQLDAMVKIRQNGRAKKISMREVIITQVLNRAVAGDSRAIEIVLLKMDLLRRNWEPRRRGEPDEETIQRAIEEIRRLN